MMAAISVSVMDKLPARCGKPPKMRCSLVRTVTAAVSSLLKKPDANVWVDGAVSSYYRETYAEAEQRLGEVRALRLAGHNNIFPHAFMAQRHCHAPRLASARP